MTRVRLALTLALGLLLVGMARSAEAAPMVSTVTPSTGTQAGGTTVTIKGSGFVAPVKVAFGGVSATNITLSGTTTITCKTPSGVNKGTVNVAVTSGTQTWTKYSSFTYSDPYPTVASVTPRVQPVGAPASVTITGTGFWTTAALPIKVTVGTKTATGVAVISSTTIKCSFPDDTAGKKTVTVTNPDSRYGRRTSGFERTPPWWCVFTVQPTSTSSGLAISPDVQVSITDWYGNVALGSTLPVTLTAMGLPGFQITKNAVNGVATFTNMKFPTGSFYYLAASSPGLTTAQSQGFHVGVPDRLVFQTQPPAVVIAGAPFSVKVAVTDPKGVLMTSFSDPVEVWLNDGAVLGRVTPVNGVATFTGLTLTRAGVYKLTVRGNVLSYYDWSNDFEVRHAVAAGLAMTTGASNMVGGSVMPACGVGVVDQYGNVVKTATNTINVTCSGARLLSGGTATAVNGVATFNNLGLAKTAPGYQPFRLTASTPGLPAIESNTFSIEAAPVKSLSFVLSPGTSVVDEVLKRVQISAHDQWGTRVDDGVPITLSFGTNPGGGSLYGDMTLYTTLGVVEFYTKIDKPGVGYKLVASSPGATSGTSAAFTVQAKPSRLVVSVPATVTAGAFFRVTAQIFDPTGAPSPTVSVFDTALMPNPWGTRHTGEYTVGSGGGAASFGCQVFRAGKGYVFQVTGAGLTAQSNPFEVLPAGPKALSYRIPPVDVTLNDTFTTPVQIDVLDAYGNLSPVSGLTVKVGLLKPLAPTAVLTGTNQTVTTNGVASFNDLSVNQVGAWYRLEASAAAIDSAEAIFEVVTPTPAVVPQPARLSGPSFYTGGRNSYAVAFGELDGDGKIDMAQVNYGSSSVTLHYGAGAGTFLKKVHLGTRGRPRDAAIGDLDGDGKGDVVVTLESSLVQVYLADPTRPGRFLPPRDFDLGASCWDVHLLDVDGDGCLDLIGTGGGGLRVALQNKAQRGTFLPAVHFALPAPPSASRIADWNGDGAPDVVCTTTTGEILVVKQDLAHRGTFLAATSTAGAPANALAFAVGDVDNDGRLDVSVGAQDGSLSIFLQDPAHPGLLLAPKNVPLTGGQWFGVVVDVVAGDVTGDGRPDLVATTAGGPSRLFIVSQGPTGIAPIQSQAAPQYMRSLVLRDLDGDGRLDLGATDGADAMVLLNDPARGLQLPAKTPFALGPVPTVADMNGDGRLDIVTLVDNPTFGDVAILYQDPTGALLRQQLAVTPKGGLAVGDLDGDGRLDVVVSNAFQNTVSVILQDSAVAGTFRAPVAYSSGSVAWETHIADLDRDGRADVVVFGNQPNDTLAIMRGDPAHPGQLLAPTVYALGSNPTTFDFADLDGDGYLDVVVARRGGTSSVLLQDRLNPGTLRPAIHFAGPQEPSTLALADLDGDGRVDLVIDDRATRDVTVYHGHGDGTFDAVTKYATGAWEARVSTVLVADLNGDGRKDIVFGVSGQAMDPRLGTLYGTAGGGFVLGPRSWLGQSQSVTVADLDRNGKVDVIYTATDGVTILRGR